ncbi:endonuclease/exonuclease/phosphatase family protein [Psychrobium sp. 1_MG-2023]|uniref:endonuclease/exonuclease/phosphatase family protein n=1 Tax=Psychrobium sp. 1_MG-2023 TaxID=3062624 RepID=UPI000C34E08B|nr:endonuclease/exonuclease/phosphatase family protein [Psychrobium sp. 1_MG-2023]MDP2560531.1 endonuclease/exonuclease/phosphatase family protein [Psychrobium sp. 1_MG-2023]PKF57522.1 endonuclease/exonuclease/phosphatase family protein [Alteromonadales bacterium alter-6D02]
MVKVILSMLSLITLAGCNMTTSSNNQANSFTAIKVASFNVSMDASNYVGRDMSKANNQVLRNQLKNNNQQIKNISEIIQRTRPDIILLNEFDYIDDPSQGIERFIKQYLNVAQHPSVNAIDYPYYYYAPVNTGKPSPYDLTGDGKATGKQGDAWGFGFFEGQYGMVLLSKYPIDVNAIRTFQHFKWKDMPNALRPINPATGEFFYNDEVWQQFPLSSKSHWDIPVDINGKTIHILASHPTPPVFDGPEDRNGKRNHDEVRFWHDYISPQQADYIYDDQGVFGGLADKQRFIIMGDQNASKDEGNSLKEAITALLTNPLVNDAKIPQSIGASQNKQANPIAKFHTAYWGIRADYVLPSQYGLEVLANGVFWPQKNQETYRLIKDRKASSDHRLVWSELTVK